MAKLELEIDFRKLGEELAKHDFVQVIRCKDCKHRDPEDHGCDCAGHEMLLGGFIPMPDDWFCADGDRREANE